VSVVVEKEGFRRWTGEVTLAAGAERSVQADLEPLPKATPKPIAARSAVPTPQGVKPGDLVPMGPDVTPPKRISGDASVTPPSRPKQKGSISVILEFIVNEDGSVGQIQVNQSGGDELDHACLKTVSGWKYSPANLKGTPVKVRQQAKFTFEYR
jgi:TonB family protein